jgi:proton-translocating NADH-quinone oxidoreductase chain N
MLIQGQQIAFREARQFINGSKSRGSTKLLYVVRGTRAFSRGSRMDLLTALFLFPLPVFSLLVPAMHQLFRASKRNLVPYWTFSALVISLGSALMLLLTQRPPTLLYGVLLIDPLSLLFAVIFLFVSTLVNVTSISYMNRTENPLAYYGLLLFSTFGMVLVGLSVDLVVLFVSWELMSVPTYVLTGILKKDPASNEAAVKYFLASAFSSGLIIYAISLLFGVTGSTSMVAIGEKLSSGNLLLEPLTLLAIALFISGFGMKVAAVPFHMWIPDAYEGAPTTIAALLAAGTKSGGFVVLLRVFMVSLALFRADWSIIFAVVAVLTMTLGNVGALMQKSFTRLLAYSSIAQSGYIMIGLAAPTTLGIGGALFHILNHAIMKSAAFFAAAVILMKLSTTALTGYSGLAKRMPCTALALTISLLALAGVPPLSGFMSKLVLFTAAVDSGMVWLALAGVLNSAFSLAYYGWVIKRMYLDDPDDTTRVHEPRLFVGVLTLSAAIIILLGVYPEPFLSLTFGIASRL